MSDFTCTPQIDDVAGLPAGELTVGRVFTLTCKGPWPQGLDPAKVSVLGLPANQRPLKILGARAVSGDVVDFQVTSYTAGDVSFESMHVSDGVTTVDLGPLKFSVASVLPQGEKVEPYGPMGPFELSAPLSWFAGPAVVLALAVFAVAWKLRRRAQRRRLMRKLDEHQSALSPLGEFHQRLRRLRRDNGIFSNAAPVEGETARVAGEAENLLRVYLMRRFRLPALDWGDGTLLRTFRRENRSLAQDLGSELSRVLREFREARAVRDLAPTDAIQLAAETAKLVEAMDRHGDGSKGRMR